MGEKITGSKANTPVPAPLPCPALPGHPPSSHLPPAPAVQRCRCSGCRSTGTPPATFLPSLLPTGGCRDHPTWNQPQHPLHPRPPQASFRCTRTHPTAARPEPGAPPPLGPPACLTHQPPPGAQTPPSLWDVLPSFPLCTQTLLSPAPLPRTPPAWQTHPAAL